jgi:hypothetical protein
MAVAPLIRRTSARVLLAAFDLAVMVFGGPLQGPTTDEVPEHVRRAEVKVGELTGSLRDLHGLGRIAVAIGGPTLRIVGYFESPSVFVPARWWRDRGATTASMGGDRHSADRPLGP